MCAWRTILRTRGTIKGARMWTEWLDFLDRPHEVRVSAFVHQNQDDVCTFLHSYFDIRKFIREQELSQLTEKSPILREVQTLLDEYMGIPQDEFSTSDAPWPLDEERDRFLLEDGWDLLTDPPCVDPTPALIYVEELDEEFSTLLRLPTVGFQSCQLAQDCSALAQYLSSLWWTLEYN
uniref:Intraflagellar transport protein 46 homolog n=1 Tax=Steinernema glaseri TaxID=37863 RepID=A0A1I7ZB68_9BILA